MKELHQFKRIIKKRTKALKRKRNLKARVRQFQQEIKALKPINKHKQEHINKLKEIQ